MTVARLIPMAPSAGETAGHSGNRPPTPAPTDPSRKRGRRGRRCRPGIRRAVRGPRGGRESRAGGLPPPGWPCRAGRRRCGPSRHGRRGTARRRRRGGHEEGSPPPRRRRRGQLLIADGKTRTRAPAAGRVSFGPRIKGLQAFDRRRHLSQRSRHHPHGRPLPWGGTRLVGALLWQQNDAWAVQGWPDTALESIAQTGDDPTVSLTDTTGCPATDAKPENKLAPAQLQQAVRPASGPAGGRGLRRAVQLGSREAKRRAEIARHSSLAHAISVAS